LPSCVDTLGNDMHSLIELALTIFVLANYAWIGTLSVGVVGWTIWCLVLEPLWKLWLYFQPKYFAPSSVPPMKDLRDRV